jgi:hypothetical protein
MPYHVQVSQHGLSSRPRRAACGTLRQVESDGVNTAAVHPRLASRCDPLAPSFIRRACSWRKQQQTLNRGIVQRRIHLTSTISRRQIHLTDCRLFLQLQLMPTLVPTCRQTTLTLFWIGTSPCWRQNCEIESSKSPQRCAHKALFISLYQKGRCAREDRD